MPYEIKMPQLGMNQDSATIVTWLKNEGDRVNKGDPVFLDKSFEFVSILNERSPISGVTSFDFSVMVSCSILDPSSATD